EETDDCAGTSKHSVRVRGEAFTGSTVYTKVSETCTPTANNYVSCSGTCYYPIGSELPLPPFVALSERIDDRTPPCFLDPARRWASASAGRPWATLCAEPP